MSTQMQTIILFNSENLAIFRTSLEWDAVKDIGVIRYQGKSYIYSSTLSRGGAGAYSETIELSIP